MTLPLIIIGLVIIGVFITYVFKSGKDSVIAQVATDQMKVAEKVADAQGNSPSTHEQLADRLQSPGGKL